MPDERASVAGQIESFDELESSGETLGRRSARGAMWAVTGSAMVEPIRLLSTVVLARLLTPADFGIIGMAAVFFGLTAITTELGPSAAIIGSRRLSDEETSSLFWTTTLIGLLLTVLALLAAPLVARLYRDARVAGVFSAMSLTVFLSAEALVHNALLRRRMDFKTPAVANLVSVAANAGVAVGCAVSGFGYWSLVAGTLVGVLTSVLIVQKRARFRPLLHLKWAEVAPYLSFSSAVTGAELANYGSINVDNFLVGRLLGAASLGVYALAYNLVTYPVRMFSSMVAQATLPALSRLQHDAEKFSGAYLQATRLSSSVVLPVLLAVQAAAPGLIVGLYGPKWVGAILPLQMLCFAGIARSVSVFARSAFKAAHRAGLQVRWDLALLIGVAAGAAIGARWGVGAVAAAVAIATSIASAGAVIDANRMLSLPAKSLIGALAPAVALALGTGVAGLGIRAALGAQGAPALVVGAVTFLGSLVITWLWGHFAFSEVRSLEAMLIDLTLRRRAAASDGVDAQTS